MLDQKKHIDTRATEAYHILTEQRRFRTSGYTERRSGNSVASKQGKRPCRRWNRQTTCQEQPRKSHGCEDLFRKEKIIKQNENEAPTLDFGRWALCCFGPNQEA
jgi:hypothetical protein